MAPGVKGTGSTMDRRRIEAMEQDAIAFLRRIDSSAGESDWLELQAWLEADPEHRATYDRVERLFAELEAAAPQLTAGLDERPGAAAARRSSADRRGRARLFTRRAFGGFAAAAAAAAIAVVVMQPQAPVATQTYETAKGETREVVLADGSHVHLNSASRLTVRFEKSRRRVELAEGEAAFDVTHDASRPFVIAAGERDVRVVGTEFDVLRHEGALRVTVLSGVVAIQAPERAPATVQPVILRAGDQLDHRAGTRLWTVSKVDPQVAFAWKNGDLIYSDRPLDEVVSDLNRYFATPLRVEGPAASLRFSGVLKIEGEVAVVRRLEAFLPVEAVRETGGVVLRMRGAQG
jgi:transmembrane sensor